MTKFKETKSKKCCGGCPFKRVNTNEKPNPGGSHPFVYLGQIHGPFWLPCHQDKNYEGKGSNTETVGQCRGAAIFRSNCGVEEGKLPKQLLSLPEDRENVFASEAEFITHYLDMPQPLAEDFTTPNQLNHYVAHEMYKVSETRRFYSDLE
tara:strand:- start:26427 stop:26876 length:450 start_codon:yes stop_codon:yes gene_type:complete